MTSSYEFMLVLKYHKVALSLLSHYKPINRVCLHCAKKHFTSETRLFPLHTLIISSTSDGNRGQPADETGELLANSVGPPRPPTHFSLDHVDASGAESLDAVVDVHHAFTLGHIQHDVQHNVAAGPARPHAGAGERGEGSTSRNLPPKMERSQRGGFSIDWDTRPVLEYNEGLCYGKMELPLWSGRRKILKVWKYKIYSFKRAKVVFHSHAGWKQSIQLRNPDPGNRCVSVLCNLRVIYSGLHQQIRW